MVIFSLYNNIMCNSSSPPSFRHGARGQSIDEFLEWSQLLLVYEFKFLDEVHKMLEGGVEMGLLA